MKGSQDISYAENRRVKRSLRYRLNRRTAEVLAAIEKHAGKPVKGVIDLGTADGRMLEAVRLSYPGARCLGVEYDAGLADFAGNEFPFLEIIQADVESLDLPEGSFDVAIAAAVIEHLKHPEAMLRGAKKALRREGIIIVTCPDPFWESVARRTGQLSGDRHQNVMDLRRLRRLTGEAGLSVVETKKFMLSPIGMPFERSVERCLSAMGMGFLMANQMLIARAD